MIDTDRALGTIACLGLILALASSVGPVHGSTLDEGAAPGVSGPQDQDAAVRQYREAFGYAVGEERRYVLEPQTSLRAGESAWWSIRLDDVYGDGDNVKVIFVISHQRSEIIRDLFGGASGRMQVVDVESTITMNRFGFPEKVVIDEQHDLSGETGSQSDLRTTTFTFDGERYVKHVRLEGRDWDFNIAVANHDDLDKEARTGMYAYLPSALNCLGRRGEPGRPRRCADGEIAFANPGLLSVALPVMWEQQVNERDFLFFTPMGVGTSSGGLFNMSAWVRYERDQLGNLTRYYQDIEIEFKEYVEEIEIGPRTVDAWKFDGSRDMREFFTDGSGKVLKVELDPHPVTRGKRWIRLLYPSEY
jgi:hypothetical protein